MATPDLTEEDQDRLGMVLSFVKMTFVLLEVATERVFYDRYDTPCYWVRGSGGVMTLCEAGELMLSKLVDVKRG